MCHTSHQRFNSVERQSSMKKRKKKKTQGPGVSYVTEKLNTQFQICVCECVRVNIHICKGVCVNMCEDVCTGSAG